MVLDNEAISVLRDPHHPKHRRVLALLEAAAQRGVKRRAAVPILVPLAVRVEANWDRRKPGTINSLRPVLTDGRFDSSDANRAAELRDLVDVSVVDATVAATAEAAPGAAVIVTSDVGDMTALAGHLDGTIRILRI